MINHEGLNKLINIMKNAKSKNLIKTGVWAMGSLCSGNPDIEFETVKGILTYLTNLVLKEEDIEILHYATTVLNYLSKRNDELMFQTMVESGCLKKIIFFLKS